MFSAVRADDSPTGEIPLEKGDAQAPTEQRSAVATAEREAPTETIATGASEAPTESFNLPARPMGLVRQRGQDRGDPDA